MPEPEKSDREPPVTVTSELAKLVDDSERVKVMAAVSPAFREETSEERAMRGRTVSTERVTVLLASVSSLLKLPETENASLAT